MPATARLEARTTPETLALLKRAAEIEGRSLTDFVVAAAERAAHRALEKESVIRLSKESSIFVAEMLLQDAEPHEGLARAFESHKKLIGPL